MLNINDICMYSEFLLSFVYHSTVNGTMMNGCRVVPTLYSMSHRNDKKKEIGTRITKAKKT